MIPEKKKIRKNKLHCDVCGKEAPPIWECRIPFCGKVASTHWIDMCEPCAAVDRKMRRGFVQGIHHAYDQKAHLPEGPIGFALTGRPQDRIKGGKNAMEGRFGPGSRPKARNAVSAILEASDEE